MSENESGKASLDLNRREFIRNTSLSSLMVMMGGTLLQAEDAKKEEPKDTGYSTVGAPVACAVIGCGAWGREIIQTLALLKNAPVVAICDTYKAYLNRAKEFVPHAALEEDYQKVLAMKEVQAVIVATPTHLHKEIVIAALQAGKHVYCEAPLANTIEDARAIAQAAKAAQKVNFQTGLQTRSDPAKLYVLEFIRNGAIGTPVMARGQWHAKESGRRASSNPDREKVLNWRMDKSLSLGLVGETGIHQLDLTSWFVNKRPVAVSGFGGILNWNDGRDVPDTEQLVLQYPDQFNMAYDCTLASSFDAEYSMLYGAYATIMMRDGKAWLFEESDCPLLGWETYASKEYFYKSAGISLSANASHSLKNKDVQESPYAESTLHYALVAFVRNCGVTTQEVANFISAYGEDAEGLKEHLEKSVKSRLPAAGSVEGFDATVVAIKASESVMSGHKIEIGKDLFEI
jgi:predicted dehydrogenase